MSEQHYHKGQRVCFRQPHGELTEGVLGDAVFALDGPAEPPAENFRSKTKMLGWIVDVSDSFFRRNAQLMVAEEEIVEVLSNGEAEVYEDM